MLNMPSKVILTRARTGGWLFSHPTLFFFRRYLEKPFRVINSNVFLAQLQTARHSYTDWTIALKLSAIDTINSIYKMHISEFWYWLPGSGQFCNLSINPLRHGGGLMQPPPPMSFRE